MDLQMNLCVYSLLSLLSIVWTQNVQQILEYGSRSPNDVIQSGHNAQIHTVQSPSIIKRYPSPQKITSRDEECLGGFSVRKAKRSTLKATKQVEFEDVITNAGGWDSNRHVFHAPCPGLYFFTFNAVSEEELGFTMALMKNDKFQVTAYGGKKGYQWGSNSAMLFLNPEDTVFIYLQDGEIYEHPFNEAYTTFTGFLVSKF